MRISDWSSDVCSSFIAGRNTRPDTVGVARNVMGSKGMARVYLADNRFDGDFVHLSPLLKEAEVDRPPCPPTVAAEPAEAAYRAVLSDAGAFPRDTFDRRIVTQVRESKGHN